MLNRATILSLVFAAAAFSDAHADNWGHWRGPSGNGSAVNATPPTQWSDTKNVKWKVAIPGKGSGSPVIWDDKVFVVTGVSQQAGDQSQQGLGDQAQGGQRRGRAARGTAPTKTKFEIICFDRESGKQLWEKTAIEATPHQGFTQPIISLPPPRAPMANTSTPSSVPKASTAIPWTANLNGRRTLGK